MINFDTDFYNKDPIVIAAADKIEISSQIFHGISELGQKLSAKKIFTHKKF